MSLANLALGPIKFAHEVYVLSSKQIIADKHAPKVNVFNVFRSKHDTVLFIAWALGIGASLLVGIYLKTRPIFQKIGRFIDRATFFAPDLIRLSLGAALIAGVHFHAVYGPELPVGSFSFHQVLPPVLLISGIAIVLGIFTRFFGLLMALFWLFALADRGWYMMTYLNYFGEALALALIPKQNISLDALIFRSKKRQFDFEAWAMPSARILFGLALLYAAINVKFVTAKLSLDVVNQYHLTRYFPFDPLFVVLGAGMVEILMAGLFILGLMQRLNSLAFIGFITASLLFFKEAVWPHYLLLGLAAGIFLHKPDKLALDTKIGK